jgi:hypothetical protein
MRVSSSRGSLHKGPLDHAGLEWSEYPMNLRLSTTAVLLAAQAGAQTPAIDLFEKKIRPVLASRCYACHSASSQKVEGGLRLDTGQGITRGGNSGSLIDPGDVDRSLILRALRHTDPSLRMPPGKPLPAEVVADFETWIRAGAPTPDDVKSPVAGTGTSKTLWSLKRPVAAVPPPVRDKKWARTDIDRFVLSRLEEKNITPAPEADKRTLIRRASYDLIGLPPTQAEIDIFLKDTSPIAYEKLVDRLLASPHYGERWGRHWLDVARYADSVNDSVNAGQRFPWSYTYRDWVIRSLNEDLPYDKFLLYQLAADRIPGLDKSQSAALGFLSLGREFPKSVPETVDDRIDAVARGMLGFTVACARCHDHKYDPIPTKDYYSFYSIFSNVRDPVELPVLGKPGASTAKDLMYEERLARIRKADQDYRVRRNGEMVAFFKTQTAEYLLAAQDATRLSNTEIEELVRDRQLNLHVLSRWRRALDDSKKSGEPVFLLWHRAVGLDAKAFAVKWPQTLTSAPEGNPLLAAELRQHPADSLKEVAETYARVLRAHDRVEPFSQAAEEQLRTTMRGPSSPADVPLSEFELIYSEGDGNNTRDIKVRYGMALAQYAYDGAPPRAMALEDVPKPVPAHVFVRGNPNNPGAETPPHFLTCIAGGAPETFRDGSGRLDLARAIISPANPLTARVIVNRVWMHHFGFGLVRTPSDFGLRGDPPTHPELLDALAVQFVESGWSLKKLHRAIMLSAVYRQSSSDNEAARKIDPENLLLWRMNRRRLDIESLRDSMLAASGRLDSRASPLPFSLNSQPSVPRRTVYGFIERGRIPAVLSSFDFASPDQHAPMRFVTTVPQQALFFLNSPFVAEQAEALAARSAAHAKNDAERITALYSFVFGRDPQETELAAGLAFTKAGAARPTPEESSSSPWQYGIGEPDPQSGKLKSFVPFPSYSDERWQGGAALPAKTFGMACLRASGGEPGELPGQAVVRRWISPVTGSMTIEGTLRHGQPAVPYGDGVRGRILSSRLGELASWSVNGGSAEAKLTGVSVQKGDILDFVVDGRADPENDAFSWAPVIKVGHDTWNAKDSFAGPAPRRLDVWAQYAQVLLETSEFAFVD